MQLTAAEVLQLALAAMFGLIGACVACSTFFHNLGRQQGESKGELERERLLDQVEKLKASISELDETIRNLRDDLNDAKGINAPTINTDLKSVLDQILVEDERDIWRTFPAVKPEGHDERISNARVKVISVANLKGGVGKTTVATNLAAYLDRTLKKKVLFLDADYQGSSSDLLLKTAELDDSSSKVDKWLTPNLDAAGLFASLNYGGAKLQRTKFVSAFYSLSSIETRLMVKWLAERSMNQSAPDLRFALARTFSTEFLNKFDVVIIDCPPRFSTATIEALCASTHLIVPTIPDASSLEATENFLNMAAKLFAELNPGLQLAAIIPMLTSGGALTAEEHARLENFKTTVTAFSGEPYIARQNVLHSRRISNIAGNGIAMIAAGQPIKEIFRDLGRELAERVGL